MSKQGVRAPAKMNKNEQKVVMGVEQSGIIERSFVLDGSHSSKILHLL